MGLDILYMASNNSEEYAFRAGSYSGFHEFRCMLAKVVAGFDYDEMLSKRLEGDAERPFYELFNHSDCDGVLTQEQCKQLHVDFVKLHRKFIATIDEEPKVEDKKWWRQRYLNWKKWTGKCAAEGGMLVFC